MVILERLPLEGACIALNPPGHGPGVYDMMGVEGASGAIASTSLWSTLWRVPVGAFHGWRRAVVAPHRGVVRATRDGQQDRPTVSAVRDLLNGFLIRPLRSGRHIGAMAGNHVVVEIEGGHILLAHLRRGSVTVEPGQAIEVGAVVGDVGNSGNSVGPHLHMQVMTSADPFDADVVAWRLAAFERWTGSDWTLVEDAPLPLRTPIRSPR